MPKLKNLSKILEGDNFLGKDNFKSDIDVTDFAIDKIYEIVDRINNNDVQREHKIIIAIAILHKADIYVR